MTQSNTQSLERRKSRQLQSDCVPHLDSPLARRQLALRRVDQIILPKDGQVEVCGTLDRLLIESAARSVRRLWEKDLEAE